MPDPILLTDDELLSFIVNGYYIIKPDMPEGFHDSVCAELDAVDRNPGNNVLGVVPKIADVYDHPVTRGALMSILGEDYTMNPHRHWHTRVPGAPSQSWHQDGTNVRHHQVWTVLAMYYPHDVSLEMGPTVVMPGTHFRNAPTDRMRTYGNFEEQVVLNVDAGTIAITHYDLWHAGTINRTENIRSMLKFVFDRKSEPTAPSWNHNADEHTGVLRSRVGEHVGGYGYCSDFYKEWELRFEMWKWMLGRDPEVPPGAFKDLLNNIEAL